MLQDNYHLKKTALNCYKYTLKGKQVLIMSDCVLHPLFMR